MGMEIGESLVLTRREQFRDWLVENHQGRKEIWLVFHKKSSGRQTLSIAEAVEETLCFGWIDSVLKPIDAEQFALRFSPRRRGCYWARNNINRVRRLIKEGKMTEAGMAVLPQVDDER
jgi:uncharacterized protein YdeI (YjbR/CyaY-like superfamily)